ncbi:hypothetical protein BOX15_Mlig033411g1 [Macrostomum lignano]|uniref:FAT domain-containing protein n=2 Tax=Macrostomum lignano TaxID=282301 RepID=A0A1I8HHK1_9PLAT|nr:hypothetical protein BOX15_Mlig033411g2 [Macrostomum lignano]PAA69728.1 hypothetical protein BOX15_Mlig033411g1 [Macrostomum lignano]
MSCNQLELDNDCRSHSLPSGVWADALIQLEVTNRMPYNSLLAWYRRALSCCPYSVRLWCQLADCQLRRGAPWPAVRDTLDAALNSGLHSESDLALLDAKLRFCAAVYFYRNLLETKRH